MAKALSQQLTRLDLSGAFSAPAAISALLSCSWPLLRQLDMEWITLGDAAVELVVRQLPQLEHLSALFKLQQDHSGQQCRWHKLDMGVLDVAAVARLPNLSSVTALRFGHIQLANTGNAAQDLQLTAAAVAAAAHCAQAVRADWFALVLPADGPPHTGQVLLAALPLLSCVTGLHVQGAHITRQLLTGLSQSLPRCTCLSMEVCTAEAGIWGSFVSLLPHVEELFMDAEMATLQQLAILCATATHPIRLRVGNEDPDEDDVDLELLAQLQTQLPTVLHDIGPGCMVTLI